jgi:hypothetical protein
VGLALTALVGAALILLAFPLSSFLANDLPIRPFSAVLCIGGAGILALGLSAASFIHPGTRAKEFCIIGSGMVGMASLVIGALTLVQLYTAA